jgi:predicted amidohydrolase
MSVQEWLNQLLHKGKIPSNNAIYSYIKNKKPVKPSGWNEYNKTDIRIAVVQMKARLYKHWKLYIDQIYLYAEEASRHKVQLLVFPANNSLQLMSLHPLYRKNSQEIHAVIQDMAWYMEDFVIRVYGGIAKAFGMYIVAGSYFVRGHDQELYNRAYLFGPTGALIGTQEKMELTSIEETWGIHRGEKVHTYETPIGCIAMVIGTDEICFEAYRMALFQGTEIVTLLTADEEEGSMFRQIEGLWGRVQENRFCGVKSTLVGDIGPFSYTGKSAIYAPISITPQQDGVLAASQRSDQDVQLIKSINLVEMQAEVDATYIPKDYNIELYEKYFPIIYPEK